MSTLTATPASTQTGKPVQLKYTGGLGGSLRLTRPNGSRYYVATSVGTGSRAYTPASVGPYKADLLTRKPPLKAIASTAFGVTAVPVTPPAPPPPANAVRVAVETGAFRAVGGTVWYGKNKWTSRTFPAGTTVACANGTFSTPALPSGDPEPNIVKECRAVVAPGPLAAVAGDRWVDLAWQT